MDKKTPLYQQHLNHHGKMVSYASFLMPVQYETGIINEHLAVRSKAGLFDVSHMGEFILEGADALKNLNYLLSNDFTDLANGKARYGILCTAAGFTVDDLLVYRLEESKFLIVVNASNCNKDYEWFRKHLSGDYSFQNISDQVGQIALQGPNSAAILAEITTDIPETYYSFVKTSFNGKPCLISRTGYTGEDGFELYCDNETIVYLWQRLLEVGEKYGLIPCGLGCRDTLRLEAGMPLYGHELSAEITPLEAGLKPFVKLNKDFIGHDALLAKPQRRRIGLQLIERGIAREDYKVYQDNKEVGYVTSGTFSPSLQKAIAMALIKVDTDLEKPLEIDVRGKRIKAEHVKLPFYRKEE